MMYESIYYCFEGAVWRTEWRSSLVNFVRFRSLHKIYLYGIKDRARAHSGSLLMVNGWDSGMGIALGALTFARLSYGNWLPAV